MARISRLSKRYYRLLAVILLLATLLSLSSGALAQAPVPADALGPEMVSASGEIHGSLRAPDGGTSFAAPNRVWVRAQNQEGQGSTVQVNETTGAFSAAVYPGNTLLKVVAENPLWAPPVTLSGSVWTVDDGASVDSGVFQLLNKDARINGKVSDDHGSPVANLAVRAWRVDGALAVKGQTDVNGDFSLAAIEGIYEVEVNPDASSPYVPAQPPQRVRLLLPTSTATQNLGVLLADVTVNGTLVDANGLAPNLEGRVVGLYRDPDGTRWPQFGQGAPIHAGAFSLKLSSSLATQYRLKAALSDLSGYTVASAVSLDLVPGVTTYTVTLPVAPNNSTITGALLNAANLAPALNLPGAVYGASNSGALKREKVNPLTGGYQFQVAALNTSGQGGTFWWLKAFVDPTSGWVVQQPRLAKVFLPYNNGNGADATANFVVAQVNAVVTGFVLNPDGTPAVGARVTVQEGATESAVAFRRWAYTNALGHYALRVPAGTYRVTADQVNRIAPIPVVVSVPAGTIQRVDMQFRAANASISGTVVYQGAAHAAFIRAYSSSGAHVAGETDLAGNWSLALRAGETWHIQAVSEDGSAFLKSERINLQVKAGADPNRYTLTLLASDTLPEALLFNFDAAQDQVLTLSNGVQVQIPAGALAVSGMVTVAVQPRVDLADDGGATPVSFGYRLLAFDEAFSPILSFNQAITLVIPFSAGQLQQLGVTPDKLAPRYWDPSSASWKPVPGYSVQVQPDGSGTVNITLEHFTDYSLQRDLYPYQVMIPLVSH